MMTLEKEKTDESLREELADLHCFQCGAKLDYISPISQARDSNHNEFLVDLEIEWFCNPCQTGFMLRSDERGHSRWGENPPKLIALWNWKIEPNEKYIPVSHLVDE